MIELKLFSFEQISIASSGLSRSGGNTSKNDSLVDLLQQLGVHWVSVSQLGELVGLFVLSGPVLDVDADTLLLLVILDTEVLFDDVVLEGLSVESDDRSLDQGVGSDELGVRGVVRDSNNFGLGDEGLGLPHEVSSGESQSSELEVSSSDSDLSDFLLSDFGEGSWSSLFKGSFLLVDGSCSSGLSFLVS